MAGQTSFASWIANAQGLLVSRPPSLNVKKIKIKEEEERDFRERERSKILKGLFSPEGGRGGGTLSPEVQRGRLHYSPKLIKVQIGVLFHLKCKLGTIFTKVQRGSFSPEVHRGDPIHQGTNGGPHSPKCKGGPHSPIWKGGTLLT